MSEEDSDWPVGKSLCLDVLVMPTKREVQNLAAMDLKDSHVFPMSPSL